MRKLSDTEFEFVAVYATADLEFTKEGLIIEKDANNLISWQDIAKAREALNLVSFTDEEFEAYAKENGYVKRSVHIPRPCNIRKGDNKDNLVSTSSDRYSLNLVDAINDARAIVINVMDAEMPDEAWQKLSRIQKYLGIQVEEGIAEARKRLGV